MDREFKSNTNIHLPPGFRFHPSDEELIVHYLKNKATSSPLPASIIAYSNFRDQLQGPTSATSNINNQL